MKYKFAPAFLFDSLTPFYDFVVELGGLGKSLQQKVIKYAQIKDGEKCLDVGCGSGTFVAAVKMTFPKCKVIGVDPDKKILDIARRKIDGQKLDITLKYSFAERLLFKSSSFDVVVSSLTFHHMPTEIKKAALKEIHRVLKKNGRFLLADIGKQSSLLWKIKFALDIERIFSSAGEYMKDNLEGKLPALLKTAGFNVKEVGSIHQGVQFLLATKNT